MQFLTRFSRAVMMGLAWAAVWITGGLIVGPLIVGELEPEHIGGPLYAGVLCGAIFSAVTGFASGRLKLEDMSFSRAAAWGAVSGALVGVLPFVIGDQHDPGDRPLWILPVAVMATLAGMSAATAVLSRWVMKQNSPAPDLRQGYGG